MTPSARQHAYAFGITRAHLLRAETAWRAGDLDTARRSFEHSLAVHQGDDYALVQLRRGQIHEALGDIAKARLHYARVVEALAPADPALVPWREEARSRLAALQEE